MLVDTANVVGSRPDGWWRDRAGAAARLVRQLGALPGTTVPGPPAVAVTGVVAVLEGAARVGVAETAHGAVRVVHAPGSADDLLAELAEPGVLPRTADRGLVARAVARGAQTVGPRWLLTALDT